MRSLIAACLTTTLTAQAAFASCNVDAMLVFDGSSSMNGIGYEAVGAPRIDEAREAMAIALPQVEHSRRIGLLTYGAGASGVCGGVDIRLAPTPQAAEPILTELNTLSPEGLTPLAVSVELAAEALGYRSRPAIVVLITDGNDTCGGQPCVLADRLAGTAADLTVHVVGFKVVGDVINGGSAASRPFPRGDVAAKCVAERTGGRYILSDTIDQLVDALNETLGCLVTGQQLRPRPTRS